MLQTTTLRFLQHLHQHNTKEWFDAHRKQYEAARADFADLVTEIIRRHGQQDADIATLTAKECMFRINRDVRFSKDKSPYKKNFAASLARGGKKSRFAGYYLHIEPGNNSFIGGGVWAPEADVLKSIRQEIDYSFEAFSGILQQPRFKTVYGDLYRDKEVALSRPPKGYTEDNAAIDCLKLKSFIAMKPLTDEELTSPQLPDTIAEALRTLQPFLRFLNAAIEG